MKTRPLFLALALSLAACEGPAEVVYQYHQALAQGRGDKALSLLDAKTRAELAQRAKAAHDASGGSVSDDPAKMIVQGNPDFYPVPTPGAKAAEVKVLEAGPERARVEAKVQGQPTSVVDVVKEGGRWRIDLPLAPLPASGGQAATPGGQTAAPSGQPATP